jgi:hypothetical protein
MSLEEFMNYKESEPNDTEQTEETSNDLDAREITSSDQDSVDVQLESVNNDAGQDDDSLIPIDQQLQDLMDQADPKLREIVDLYEQIKDVDYSPVHDLVDVPSITISDSTSESIPENKINSSEPSQSPSKRRGRPKKENPLPLPNTPTNEPYRPLTEPSYPLEWRDPVPAGTPSIASDTTGTFPPVQIDPKFGINYEDYHMRNTVHASVTVTLTGNVSQIMRVLALLEEVTNAKT